jgi:uncharacterized membrane protein YedE/YeeE
MYWNWKIGSITLGLTFLVTVALTKPIGVSTEFVLFDAILAKTANPELVVKDETTKSGYNSANAYLASSGGSMAKSVAKPLNYGIVFVLSIIVGGLLGRLLSPRDKWQLKQLPEIHQQRFGNNLIQRYVLAFVGGVLVLWGARLAGGCTSGHMMSGMMQTAVSGYLFALGAFIVAIPTAILFYKR